MTSCISITIFIVSFQMWLLATVTLLWSGSATSQSNYEKQAPSIIYEFEDEAVKLTYFYINIYFFNILFSFF